MPHCLGESEPFPMKLKKASLFDPSRALALLHHLHVQGMPPGKALVCHRHTCAARYSSGCRPRGLLKACSVLLQMSLVAVTFSEAVTGLDDHERLQLLAGMVNLTHAQQLGALGALLSILQEVGSFMTLLLCLHYPLTTVEALSILQSVCG